MTWKELKLLASDWGVLVTLFILPTIFLLVMSQVMAGLFSQGNLPLVTVTNSDRGPVAARIIQLLQASDSLQLQLEPNRNLAEQQVTERRVIAALIFPANFSSDVFSAQASGALELLADPATPLQVLAPVQGLIQGTAERTLAEAVVLKRLQKQPEILRTLKLPQLQLTTSYTLGNGTPEERPNSLQQNVPAWTIFGIFFIVSTLGLSMLRERDTGTLLRLQMVPVAPAWLLIGKLLPFWLVNMLQAALMFAVGVGVLHFDMGTHLLALLAITAATAATATSMGLMLATFFRSAEQLSSVANVSVVILAALGGILVPTFVMPLPLRLVATLIPQNWALVGYQNVLLRNQDIGGILPQIGMLLFFTCCFFLIALSRLQQACGE